MVPRVLTPLVDISVAVPADTKDNIAIKVHLCCFIIALSCTLFVGLREAASLLLRCNDNIYVVDKSIELESTINQ